MRVWIVAMMGALAVAGCKPEEPPPPVDTAKPEPPAPLVQITPIGDPMWAVADLALFTGPAGDGTQTCLLAGGHAFDGAVWSPGTPHEPPYETELSGGIDGCGLLLRADLHATDPAVFDAAELQAPNGIWLGLIVAPEAGNAPGSSPDFGLGDVIYDDRFPMVIDADVRRDGLVVDSDHDSVFSKPEQWGFVVTGHSHVPMIFGTTHERMPAGASAGGSYAWHVSLRDATSIVSNSGYDLVVPYTVNPEPE